MADGVRVTAIDHLVLNVADPNRSLAFYCDDLGLSPERVDEWRRGECGFPSVRIDAATIIDLVQGERSGENLNHFCLVAESLDFDALIASGRFDVVREPATRFGARGNGTSLYVRDPDGNVIELRTYG